MIATKSKVTKVTMQQPQAMMTMMMMIMMHQPQAMMTMMMIMTVAAQPTKA
jgi:hypothetical protein